MQPIVSILIPVYNAEEWLADTLECALGQTWLNKEVIIVDDGSTDNSLEIARRHKGSNVKVISQENQGACAARNRALTHAQGQYIQYLDADDLMPADKIEVQMRALRSGPPDSVASTRWCRFYEQIGDGPHPPVPERWENEDPLEWLIEAQSGRAMLPPIGWLAPRSVIEEAGPWNEDLLINQDGEYFSRVLLQASQIVFCPETEVYYRSGISMSVSSRHSPEVLRSQYKAARRIEQHMRSHEDSPRVRQACAHAFQRIAYAAYPKAMDVVEKAESKVDRLGGSDMEPLGGSFFRVIGRILGWKTALWIRHNYHRLRDK
ncbi:glycosyltransferase involved in cell wall biosynthesis [Salinibacter ruber]|uniref:glycosyltransferase family 2 protein n=1 Tax=Salinibacter ruber TaxID=146919 RepID=UPI0021678E45|nr:glycosyltransferase family 2 protein [Salinibacter ruber]MCS4086116.1 glycosyltransferase involved in cell wall biosynthesis [Salinibacter ruber]